MILTSIIDTTTHQLIKDKVIFNNYFEMHICKKEAKRKTKKKEKTKIRTKKKAIKPVTYTLHK